MEINEIKQLLFDRYIKPTKRERTCCMGIEIEMPIVNLNKEAVDFDNIHTITKKFIEHFNFDVAGIDEEGNIYSAADKENGDILSYDCSYNNLELSFGKECNLFTVWERFQTYYKYLQSEFKVYNYTLTGMGINPYRIYNHNVPIPNGRYRMLFHHLQSYKKYLNLPMYFHKYPEYGTFSSASQVQLDIAYDELPLILNVFSKLEPIKALIFSNSVILEEHEEIVCYRDFFWENSTHGINPHNIGMYSSDFESVEDILTYISTTSIYCVERGDKYINFEPIRFADYLNADEIIGEYYDNGEYKNIVVKPVPEDIKYLRTFKFEDMTFRGTVEFRSVCCQPIKDNMSVAAFHIGAQKRFKELNDIFEADTVLYNNGYMAAELRKMFLYAKLPEFVDQDKLYELTEKVLDIISDGVKERGLGEEEFLKPLYERVKNRTNPAKDMLALKNSGTDMNDIILKYAEI